MIIDDSSHFSIIASAYKRKLFHTLKSPQHTEEEIEMAGNVVAVTFALLIALRAPIATTARVPEEIRTDFISTRCNLTKYPPLCRASLSSKVQSSHEQLARAAVSVSLEQAKSALAAISSTAKSVAPLKPGESMVLRDCVMTMRDSVQKLQKSHDEMGGGKSWAQNARTWVSAALTEENMCADELQGVDLAGKGVAVRGMVLGAAKHTSNALGLISSLGSTEGIAP